MTRNEAVSKVNAVFTARWPANDATDGSAIFVDSLIALGLFIPTSIDDATFKAAAERLDGVKISVVQSGSGTYAEMAHSRIATVDRAGALEIMDVLRKSGFKVTKE